MELAPGLSTKFDAESLAERSNHKTPTMRGRSMGMPLTDFFITEVALHWPQLWPEVTERVIPFFLDVGETQSSKFYLGT